MTVWRAPPPWTVPLMLALLAAPTQAARDVGPQRECATCHVMWLKDFNRDDVTPLIPYEPKPVTESGRQDAASTERMCFSCHDGFMLDSRSVWANKQHEHPVGMKPSDKIRIPTSGGKVVFPLNDDGKMYCGTCHTAHGVNWDQKESPVFLRVKNVDSSLCLACHLDRSTGPAEGNHPIFKALGSPPEALMAAGARVGRKQDVICQSCHRVHGATQKQMLVLDNRDSKLCAACHADKSEIANTKHDLSVMAPQARNRLNQSPAESGPCGVCHVPHGGNGPALWARLAPPASADATAAACLACHNPEGLAKHKLTGAHTHPVNVSVTDVGITPTGQGWVTRFTDALNGGKLAALPLFDRKGMRDRLGTQVGCGTCHDPHRWSPSGDARAPDPRKIEGGPKDSFLRLALDEDGSLCVNCHVDKRTVATSPHNLAAAKDQNAASGLCQSCHQVHDAKGKYLWTRADGPGKGITEVRCTSCHREGGVAAKKLTGAHSHPVGVRLARSMQPKLPLFGADGAAKKQIDCGTCHDVHRWDPNNIAPPPGAKNKGDARTSFLRKAAAPNGELCIECHVEQRFVRGTDHDLAVTAPDSVNALGQSAAQSGVCGQCHAVHNAADARRLWARAPGDGADDPARRCTSCHAAGKTAAAKVPPETRHPAGVMVWADAVRARFGADIRAVLPVFDANGNRGIERGTITCPTCHEPHRWNARAAEEGAGKNLEGDVRNSFLRAPDTEHVVCADCHGKDALFRYKYFHSKAAHRSYPLFR